MAIGDLREYPISRSSVFKGKLLDVRRDEVRLPDGTTSIREYICHPGAVVMVPLLTGMEVILIRQFRYPIGEVMIELPAGKIDPGELPVETAKRELMEEVGFSGEKFERLGLIHPGIGYSNERMEIYLVTGLTATETSQDHDEFIEPFRLQLPVALDWIRQGKISDVKTIIALYWTERAISAEGFP